MSFFSIDAIKEMIVDIPDFPKTGIVFKDVTPILSEARAFDSLIDIFARSVDIKIDKVVAIESRGFLIGAPLARQLNVGLVLVRKKGKLPRPTISCSYGLEYGNDTLEIQKDDLKTGERVLIVDDVLATGGTASATGKLCQELGCRIEAYRFLIGLKALGGEERLNAPSKCLIEY